MDFIKLPLWKRWLSHSLIIWVITNVYGSLSYAFQIAFINGNGYGYTFWKRLENWNLSQPTIIYILIGILLVEINVLACRGKKLRVLILGSVITGAIGWVMITLGFLIKYRYIVMTSSIPFFLISGYAFTYPILLEVLSHRIIYAEKQLEQSGAELSALKSQINPHFLFNTLNSLYGTAIREQATGTAAGIERLANMMRYVLNEASATLVPVSFEVNFLRQYLDLQRMRLPEVINDRVHVDISYDENPALVAPLLLIPFIENAFKYGVDINQSSYIRIKFSVVDGRLEMDIVNSISNIQPGAGTGIANAKKRMELLYPNRHVLQLNSLKNEFQVHLTILL